MPITDTRLLRECQGAEYVVIVTADAFDRQGGPYWSLSAIARHQRHALERMGRIRPQELSGVSSGCRRRAKPPAQADGRER
jgi:hypothetical protein